MKMTKPFDHSPSAALRLILPSTNIYHKLHSNICLNELVTKKMQQLTTQQRVWICLQGARLHSTNATVNNTAESLNLFTGGTTTQYKCSATWLEAALAWNRPFPCHNNKEELSKVPTAWDTTLNRDKGNSGRKRTAGTNQNIARVR